MKDLKYLSCENFTKLLESLQEDFQVYVPVKKGERLLLQVNQNRDFSDNVIIGEVRPFDPLKAFFIRAREVVAEAFSKDIPHISDKPLAIMGVKGCDLKGFKIQDYVFLNHDYRDPFYAKMREDNLIISSDCTCVIDTCFCIALGVNPYPKENFDINLSEINGGFLAEIGSEKGQKIVNKNSSLFLEAADKFISERDSRREKITREVEKNISESDVPGENLFKDIITKNYNSDIWKDESETCVECGACTIICPTCHCFLLYDQKNEEKMERLRIWDSCMIKDYARVAGGENPRAKLWMRLRNRFEKKFDFFPKVAEVYACTGCGRCISACPAKIDIRKVLNKLVKSDERKP